MYIIQNVIVSDAVTQTRFACDLSACKGACCWEGDYGAPLEDSELTRLEEVFPAVDPYLTSAGRQAIAEQGLYTTNRREGTYDTPLVDGKACAYLTIGDSGVALCGIERAFRDGKIDWPKPISCHLYPIRVRSKPAVNFEALNYDEWSICAAACTKGEREEVRVYEFARAALERKYGPDWWDELDAAVKHADLS